MRHGEAGVSGGHESLSIVWVCHSGGAAWALGVGLCVPCLLVSCGYMWPSKEERVERDLGWAD